jgi:hypothetical protein
MATALVNKAASYANHEARDALYTKNMFVHPCSACLASMRPFTSSAWILDSAGDNYHCKACEVHGRHTVLTVNAFAGQVAPEYAMEYRIHRSKLFQ